MPNLSLTLDQRRRRSRTGRIMGPLFADSFRRGDQVAKLSGRVVRRDATIFVAEQRRKIHDSPYDCQQQVDDEGLHAVSLCVENSNLWRDLARAG
jgi:hypothetical protein